MQNKISSQIDRLLTAGEDAAVGCHNHEATIGLKQNNEVSVRALLTALLAADTAYQAARTGKLVASAARRTADQTAKAFITFLRDRLKKVLGNVYTQMWAEVGFVNNSLKVPRTSGSRQAMLLKNKSFLTTHTALEVPAVDLTATEAQARYDVLSTARATANACRGDVAEKKLLRNKAASDLRTGLRGLITELTQLIPGDDARWRTFGFNPPDAVGLPAVPVDVTVIPSAPGHLLAEWPRAPLADRYRLYRKIMGVDSDYVPVKTVTENAADVNTMVSGQVVRIRISSVNDAGESPLSEPVEQTVP